MHLFYPISKGLLAVVFFQFFLPEGIAQGIKGRVISEDGEPLAYASVFVRNINDGVPTNEEGLFEMGLAPGHYDIIVQHLGHKSEQRTVEIQESWMELNFKLELQTYALQEVEVTSGKEDPALTVMRRAIAKAKYHRLQVQEYRMMVYLKGTGQLSKAPFFLRKKLKEEGIGLNEAFTTESVSEITFKQPNQVEERVISIRTSGENNQTSPAPYLGASFYHNEVNGAVSPLSTSAFAYYRFQFEGSFFEDGLLINKIRVIPRSKGELIFDGFIYIIEGFWAIHSLNLKTSLYGFDIQVTQQYAPVEENVWMPLTHTYTFGGKFFGFAGEYTYLASTRDYSIQLNRDLVMETEILDEKVEEIPEDAKVFDKKSPVLEQMAEQEQMSRKDFRKMIDQYEKDAIRERKNAEIISERNYTIDSLAKKRPLAYWDSIRPVKLTEKEMLGYKRDDSLALVETAKRSDVDSIAQHAKRKFSPLDIFTGGTYSFGDGRSAGIDPNLTKLSFNTVEGVKVGFGGYYRLRKFIESADSLNRPERIWEFKPELRYGFASKKLYGTFDVRRTVTDGEKSHYLGLEGGKYIYQFNREGPINELVNASYSLFLRTNPMKLYEETFAKLYWQQSLNRGFVYQLGLTYAERSPLSNQADFSFYRKPGREYSSNQPVNVEVPQRAFDPNRSMVFRMGAEWRPGQKYMVRNGRKISLTHTAPLIRFNYSKGIPNFGGQRNAADFDFLELGVSHEVRFGVSGKLDFNVQAGSFINNREVHFMDYKHFGGNRTIFTNMGAATNFRFLDYYKYSTETEYISGILHYQFRKFLLTQLPYLRFSGLRENIFFNYLKTQHSPHYMEVGYSLDNLFRVFRVEMGAGFENGNYSRGGLRLGVATFININ